MSCNLFAASKQRGIKPSIDAPITTLQTHTKEVTHVVRKGETLSKIAAEYKDVTYQDIANANGITDPNNIYIGQRLKIPHQPPVPNTPNIPTHRKPVPDETSTGKSNKNGCCKCEIDKEYFFKKCKTSSSKKVRIEKIFNGIKEYYSKKGRSCNLKQIAYMLATIKHETAGTFKPITEYGGKTYFNRYDPVLANTQARRNRAIKMGNTQKGDGYKYRGRGFVQLTWKKNYKKAGDYLGIDLVNHPKLALEQDNATKIMIYGMETGMFTTRKLSNYITNSKADYYNARKIINGHDKASTIEKYAKGFEKCLRLKKCQK